MEQTLEITETDTALEPGEDELLDEELEDELEELDEELDELDEELDEDEPLLAG